MAIFTNARETKFIHDILSECGQLGNKVYFSNLYYLNESGERVEILWVYAPKISVYSELEVCVDDKVRDLWTSPHMVVTMVYLEIQKLAREYKKEELKVGDKVLSNGDEIEITQEMLDYYKRCKTIFGITDYVKLNQNKDE